MAAEKSFLINDGVGAAHSLANAHAFLDDGEEGLFGVDGTGVVWGSHSSGDQAYGQPFQITLDSANGLLNMLANGP